MRHVYYGSMKPHIARIILDYAEKHELHIVEKSEERTKIASQTIVSSRLGIVCRNKDEVDLLDSLEWKLCHSRSVNDTELLIKELLN